MFFFSLIGRSPTDGHDETPAALHELNDVLRGLPVSAAARLPLPLARFQVHTQDIPAGQDLPVLGVHGSD